MVKSAVTMRNFAFFAAICIGWALTAYAAAIAIGLI